MKSHLKSTSRQAQLLLLADTGLACFLFLVSICISALPLPSSAVTMWHLSINTNNIVAVTNAAYGAVGDGISTNTFAIQSAINTAARGGVTNGLRGGVVRIPASTNAYVCGPLNLSNNIDLQIESGAVLTLLPYGAYPGAPYTSSVVPFISGPSGLTNIAVTGSGVIDGQGHSWWQVIATNSSAISRPAVIYFPSASELLLQDFTSTNPPNVHISLSGAGAGNIDLINLKLIAPDSSDPLNPSFNTDGVDFSETNALFQGCFISTGDDDIAFNSGAADVLVTNCSFGYGHGLSIGSFTSGGVAGVTVDSCSFSNTGCGIKIKSERNRGGVVRNLNYNNLTMTNVASAISIYAYYELGIGTLNNLTPQYVANYTFNSTNPVPYEPPIYQDITFSNVTATVAPNSQLPFLLWGLPDYPASNVIFKSMRIVSSSGRGAQIYGVTNMEFVDCSWSLAGGKIQLWNAGVTFTNRFPGTNLLYIDGLTTNSIGNSLEFDNAIETITNTNAIAGGALGLNKSTFIISNNLTLLPNTPLTYAIGTNPAILSVIGNINMGGVVNITAGSGFGYGAYLLITNTGTVLGTAPALGSAPPGYTYSFDTNTHNQMKLIVAQPNAPAVPVGVNAATYDAVVLLQWPPVPSATSYNVKRATVDGGPFVTLTNVAGTNYADVGLANDTTYYYVVSAMDGTSESGDSKEVAATPTCMAPPTPSGISATAGNARVTLSWLASITAEGYEVYRATTPSGPYVILGGVGMPNYIDSTTVNGTTYYYKVTATNECGESLNIRSPTMVASPAVPAVVYQINSGGQAIGPFAADNYFSAGNTSSTGSTVSTNGLVDPAPMSVYQTERYGNMTYTFTNLVVGSSYLVRLHFAEIYSSDFAAGKRLFNVFINGIQMLTNFDIYVTAGNSGNKAVIQAFSSTADDSGKIAIQYATVADNAKSSGIEILSAPSAPVITSQPADQTVGIGGTATFSATAAGYPRLGYQWIQNGTNLVGQTANTLTITNIQPTCQGSYCVLVTNIGGSAVSRYAALTIASPSTQPTNIIFQISGNQLQLIWPQDHLGWRLLVQTNNLNSGLGTNWFTVPDSTNATSAIFNISPSNVSVFFQLIYP